ncbi:MULTISPECIES: hypothetical protein [Pseudomonas]|jgi:hypothetical protein|uniref:hypothetical protein n=1 Tax=Pseudomonas TaxID=286 RepID=UPI00300286EF
MTIDPAPALLYRLTMNQNALCAAIELIAGWVDEQGSTDACDAIRAQLATLSENSDSIAEALAELMTRSPRD